MTCHFKTVCQIAALSVHCLTDNSYWGDLYWRAQRRVFPDWVLKLLSPLRNAQWRLNIKPTDQNTIFTPRDSNQPIRTQYSRNVTSPQSWSRKGMCQWASTACLRGSWWRGLKGGVMSFPGRKSGVSDMIGSSTKWRLVWWYRVDFSVRTQIETIIFLNSIFFKTNKIFLIDGCFHVHYLKIIP